MLLSAPTITNGHLGLLMLALVVVAIMLGFPTAFTLMGMGMIFTWLAYDRDVDHQDAGPDGAVAFKVMGNDVLISIPLFVFMGYLVERANLIEKLFRACTWRWRACPARWRWPRCSPARCLPPPPASWARWSR
jgi:TRAP-type mannitol/chloroaromatic compound transport system permease large subunit